MPFELPHTAVGRATFVKQTDIIVPQALPNKLSFIFGTYGKTVQLEDATFEVFNSDGASVCRYTAQEKNLADNSELIFHRSDACAATVGSATATLEISTENVSKIALWAKGPKPTSELQSKNAQLYFPLKPGAFEQGLVPLGFSYVASQLISEPVFKRLAFAWNLPSAWIFFAAFLMSYSFALIHLVLKSGASANRGVLLIGLAAFALASSTSVFILPFQAPDEPDHALTMANAMNSSHLIEEFETLAMRTHLERIKFNPGERLLTADLNQPASVAWGAHVAPTDLNRSAVSTRLWRALAPAFASLSGSEALLLMRLLQSFLFAVCAAWSLWILGLGLGSTHVLAWLAVPTIPFFAMHVSNYGPLVSITLVFSAAVVALVWGQKTPKTGFAFGASTAFLLATSRSVWAFAPALFVVFILGLFVRGEDETPSQRLKYWLAICTALSLFWLVVTPEFLEYVLSNVTQRLPVHLNGLISILTETPASLPVLLVIALAADHLFSKIPSLRVTFKKRAIQILMTVVLLGLMFSFVLPFVKTQFILPDIETPAKIPLAEYLKKSMTLAAGLFRAANHDFYLSRSFFGGFGWLEAPLPQWTTTIILFLAAGGLVAFLLGCRNETSLGRLLRAGVVVFGLLVSVGLSAKGNWDESVNLHGRYIIPFYVTLLSLCFSGFALPKSKTLTSSIFKKGDFHILILQLIVFSVAILHIYSIQFLFERYFG